MRERGHTHPFVREGIVQAVVLLLLLIPLFPGVFFKGELTLPAWLLYEQYPWKAYAPSTIPPQNPMYAEVMIQGNVWYTLTDRAFERGEWPLWNPYQLTGMPLLANYQTAVFYPFRLVFRVLGDTHRAMTFYVLLKIWLCGMTAYFCGRAFGLPPPCARFLSVAYALGGVTLIWCYFTPPDCMAWVPLQVVGVELLLSGRYRRGGGLLFVGAVLTLLGGHPQTAFTASCGTGLYFFLRLVCEVRWGRRLWLPIVAALAAWMAALVVCAVQLLPFLELLRNGVSLMSMIAPGGTSSQSYTATSLLSLWAPRFFGTEAEGNYWGILNHNYLGMLYLGIPVWVGGFLVWCRPGFSRLWRMRILCLGIAASACLLLAVRIPGVSAVFSLPVLDSVRPVYFFTFVSFAAPMIAAAGLHHWLKKGHALRQLGPAVVLSAAIAGLLVTGWVFRDLLEGTQGAGRVDAAYMLKQCVWACALVLLSLGLLGGLGTRRRLKRWAPPLLTALLALDLLAASHGLLSTAPRTQMYFRTDLTDYLGGLEKPVRVKGNAVRIPGGLLTAYSIEQLYGYEAVQPKRFNTLHEAFIHDGWSNMEPLLATPYGLFAKDSVGDLSRYPEFEVSAVLDHIAVIRNTQALPRARLAGRLEEFASTERMFARMHEPGFDPARVVVTDEAIQTRLAQKEGPFEGTADIVVWEPQRVVVKTQAERESVLVLADAYYPGWRVLVDGRDAEVFPAYHLLRGVILDSGEHTVEFVYRPPSFYWGLGISTGGLLLLAGLGLRSCRRRPRMGR